jgi:thiol:disulfide interchange protein DsbD
MCIGGAKAGVVSLWFLRAGVLLASLTAGPVPAYSQSHSAATAQVSVRLVADHQVVHPGQQILLGVEQKIAPHWHTYWLNPGDSGEATKISWALPNGAVAGAILWPVPQRIDVGPVTNYGYSDAIVLLSHIALPETLATGSTAHIAARVSWLVCNEECIPQEAELILNLPVAETPQVSADAALLETASRDLPQTPTWPIQVRRDKSELVLQWPVSATSIKPETATFFSQRWGLVTHHAAQQLNQHAGNWQLKVSTGDAPPNVGDKLGGVLVLTSSSGRHALDFASVVQAAAPPPEAESLSLWAALVLALIGGVVLNLMPCVFPVLSIKALSLIKQTGGSSAVARRHGFIYMGGVLASFAFLALLLITFKAAGSQVGWGFQFQSPIFVGVVACTLFAVGLSMSGVFTFGFGVAGLGSEAASRAGYSGSFFSGVLAAVVATPCTAPFMGAAVAFALAQPATQLLAVFLSLGFGLALPYLLLSCWPALQAGLPRPGPWMDTLKQALAFPMYGASIWLVWVLAQQSGAQGVLLVLKAAGLIALAAWTYQQAALARAVGWRRTGFATAVLATLLATWRISQLAPMPGAGAPQVADTDQESYTPGIDSIATSKADDIARAENYVRAAISELAAGKRVTQANTKPYGCSIKYADS